MIDAIKRRWRLYNARRDVRLQIHYANKSLRKSMATGDMGKALRTAHVIADLEARLLAVGRDAA